MFQSELSARKVDGEWTVESAGSWVQDLIPATSEAFFEAQRRGLDLSNHIAKGIEVLDLDSVDLFLVMEQGQKESILIDFPKLRNRIYLLSELSGPPFSIPDPYVTKEPSDVIAQEIETLIKDNVDNIIALAKTNKHS